MDVKVDNAIRRLEDALSPYGYYLEDGKEENTLRLTFVELGVMALGVLVWGITEYAKGVISERAKKDANRIFSGGKPKEEDLRRQLNEVIGELRQLKERVHSSEAMLLYYIGEDRLIRLFEEMGMSSRAAKQAAVEIHPILTAEVAGLLVEEHL